MDRFASQVASYYAGTEYQRQDTDQEIRPDDRVMRDIALSAYHPTSQIDGFTLVPGLSTHETVTYVNPITRQAVVSFRGSTTREDWLVTDTALAVGKLQDTARFQRAKQDLDNAKSNLKNYSIYLTGHSLGSRLGEDLSDTPGVKDHTGFNTGYGIADMIPEQYKPARYKHANSRSYINKRDYVSMSGRRNDNNVYYSQGYLASAHKANPRKWSNTY